MRLQIIHFLSAFFILILTATFAYAEANPSEAPFTIGSPCATNTAYEWNILARTKWSIDMAFALPPEITDPDEWSSATAYRSEMELLLSSARDASSVSNACLDAWPHFTGSSTNLLVRFTRQFSRTTRTVRCLHSAWSIESEFQSFEPDYSDWLDVPEQPHFYNQTNANDLAAGIQTILNRINSQPGSDTTPSNTYTQIQ